MKQKKWKNTTIKNGIVNRPAVIFKECAVNRQFDRHEMIIFYYKQVIVNIFRLKREFNGHFKFEIVTSAAAHLRNKHHKPSSSSSMDHPNKKK
jgi:hypothetical protein